MFIAIVELDATGQWRVQANLDVDCSLEAEATPDQKDSGENDKTRKARRVAKEMEYALD